MAIDKPAAFGPMAAHWVSVGTLLLPGAPQNGWQLNTIAGEFALLPLPQPIPLANPVHNGLTPYRVALSDGTAPSQTQINQAIRGPLRAELVNAKGEVTKSTGVQFPLLLDEMYGRSASERAYGAVVAGDKVTFTLWAPTASQVNLLLWEPGSDLTNPGIRVPMVRQSDGAWTFSSDTALNDSDLPLGAKQTRPGIHNFIGAKYLYEVSVYAPTIGETVTNVVTDPVSIGLTLGSTHSVVVDLNDPQWAPEIWSNTPAPRVEMPVDHTIYELHVRDFSRDDATVPPEWRGKYLAFTLPDSAGVNHLRQLAAAGMNTIHLLPTFDLASIPENPAEQQTPGDLSSYPPDSTMQQEKIEAIRDNDAWNWGYDPWHWSTPEGSYAVKADGGHRTYEFRAMVGALHALGYEVVADQVFNHTMSSGQDKYSVLDKIVPGYYHRQCMRTGEVFNSTCCANIATEHQMAEKMMVDSVVMWAKQYQLDGFRFDLMGHHTRANMLAIRAALDKLTLDADGVDGKSIYLYGEGWNFGEVKNDALFVQARQGNLGGTEIGTFSDRLRDAVLGGTPTEDATIFAQGFGTGLFFDPNGHEAELGDPTSINNGSTRENELLAQLTDDIKFGLAGNLRFYELTTYDGVVRRGDQVSYGEAFVGYADQPAEVVNYVDAHDNEALYDLLVLKLPVDLPMSERVRHNILCLGLVTLSQAVSFWHAGTELLRSKSLDRNSFDSGDWFNFIDWTGTESGFGRGLPPAADNQERWEFERPLLADPTLKPTPAAMQTAFELALDLLRLRFSTRLFRLGSADLTKQKVSFPKFSVLDDTSAKAAGIIVMLIDDLVGEDIDPDLKGVVAVFNARPDAVDIELNALANRNFQLSPIQSNGKDERVKSARFTAGDVATISVPARTIAVFIEPSA